MKNKQRCAWVNSDPLYIYYHDTEWGRPIYDERLLFEFLILEGAQAGLSWITILKKREQYRLSFDHFNAHKIANYRQNKITTLLNTPGIVRNELKIKAAVQNAQAFLAVKKEWDDFADYIWHFVEGKPIQNHWRHASEVPVKTTISDRMANDLKKRGFKFVGSTICYAFMQAVGMVNDHTCDCFLYQARLST